METIPRPRREAHVKTGVVIALRMGDPSTPHVLSIVRTTHENRLGEMVLTHLLYDLVQVDPCGLTGIIDRLAEVVRLGRTRAETGLGQCVVVVDVTRQPRAYVAIAERIQATVYCMITAHGRLMASTPYWYIGRMTVLSYLNVLIAKGLVQFLPPPVDDPRYRTKAQIQEALSNARAKPPKMDVDGELTDTTPEDDMALSISLAAMYAEMSPPDPWVPDAVDVPVRYIVPPSEKPKDQEPRI